MRGIGRLERALPTAVPVGSSDRVHLVNGWDVASSVASMVTALAVAFAVGQLVVARQQSHREFENMYVQRFWAIIDQFTDKIALQPAPRSFKGHDRVVALSYIRLCEDELDMR